ncbi:hypothetical protein [Streptomyces sp. H27-C3]|uniref:hypothetical protein n=1 Tax=Streptomyces sp. H27-C3 TaxID=3046305 RepID=UPI0024BA2DDD|nr:hypothetical protein [Streptomyces sp. H27-C3]MDJ0463073.1 hypothetical protein [Streptomyces sp. H27-C3]
MTTPESDDVVDVIDGIELKRKGNYLWFRHDGVSYEVKDDIQYGWGASKWGRSYCSGQKSAVEAFRIAVRTITREAAEEIERKKADAEFFAAWPAPPVTLADKLAQLIYVYKGYTEPDEMVLPVTQGKYGENVDTGITFRDLQEIHARLTKGPDPSSSTC